MQFDHQRRKRPPHGIYVGFLTLFSFALYWRIFTYNTFGPETPLFFIVNDGLPFRMVMRSYTYFALMWYRPTAFGLPYWLIQQFVGWHNLPAWKLFHFFTVLATAYALYWLVVRCLGQSRIAGLLSVTYFVAQPSLYAAVMEVAGFDFLHILFTVLSTGFYLLGSRAAGRRCLLLTALSWLMFLIAITAKEMALATPGFLLIASLLTLRFEASDESLRSRAQREALRLLPFFALLPVYYFVHVIKIPPGTFQAAGPYRASANRDMILANLRKFPLWIVRIYAWSDQTPQSRMYQSTTINNLVGIGTLLLVMVEWRRRLRRVPSSRLVLWLMLAWTGVYFLLPAYSGGFIWHIDLVLIGYCVLFGVAIAGWFDAIPRIAWRRAALAAFFIGALFLGRENLRAELYSGVHAIAFRINHSILERPPVAAAALGRAPLVYIEDRLSMGPWWYGCYGSLFKFTYLRHDIDEVIVPVMTGITREARDRWLHHPNAFFFRYDEEYNWHDASAEFRAAASERGLHPGEACSAGIPPGGREPIRIAVGRPAFTDRSGAVWEADRGYEGGQIYVSMKEVKGTATRELYRNERFNDGPFEYRFCVANGTYTVRLKFAEIWFAARGKRIFDVAINGSTVLSHFDIAAQAGGPERAIDRDFRTTVTGGRIVIQFRPVLSNPKISAIEIVPSG